MLSKRLSVSGSEVDPDVISISSLKHTYLTKLVEMKKYGFTGSNGDLSIIWGHPPLAKFIVNGVNT